MTKEQFYTNIIGLIKQTKRLNWDLDQGLPILPQTYARACRVAVLLNEQFELEYPRVVPCGDGTVYLSWTLYDKTRLIMEVSKIMDFDVLLRNKGKNISGWCNEQNIIELLKPFCIIEEQEDDVEIS